MIDIETKIKEGETMNEQKEFKWVFWSLGGTKNDL